MLVLRHYVVIEMKGRLLCSNSRSVNFLVKCLHQEVHVESQAYRPPIVEHKVRDERLAVPSAINVDIREDRPLLCQRCVLPFCGRLRIAEAKPYLFYPTQSGTLSIPPRGPHHALRGAFRVD